MHELWHGFIACKGTRLRESPVLLSLASRQGARPVLLLLRTAPPGLRSANQNKAFCIVHKRLTKPRIYHTLQGAEGNELIAKKANVLTPVDGLHYEPPVVRCYEPNDHVAQASPRITCCAILVALLLP